MKRLLIFLLLWVVPIASAQDVCPVLTDEMIEALKTQCRSLEVGQVCVLDEEPAELTTDGITAPALVKVSQGLTVALTGDAVLTPVESEISLVTVTNNGGSGVNLRQGPGTSFAQVGVLGGGASAEADGISADGQWFRLIDGAWVFGQLVSVEGDAEALAVLDETSALTSGTMAFTLTASGDCQPSGLLFSTRGEAEITLNDIPLSWDASTAFVRVVDDETLELVVNEGEITANVNETDEVVTVDEVLRINADGVEREDTGESAVDVPFALVTVDAGAPEEAVYSYLEARTQSDRDLMLTLSCAAWDSQAMIQSQSFRAMNAELKDVVCTTASSDGESAVVTCDGVIVTTYNGQTREWALSDYEMVQEEGEWRVCGEAD